MVAFEVTGTVGVAEVSDSNALDPIRDAFDKVLGITLDPPTSAPVDDAFSRVAAGTISYASGLTNNSHTLPGAPGGVMGVGFPFGMSYEEYISWYYQGGGRAAYVAELASAGITVEPFLIGCNDAEGGGWFKEPMTLKKLQEGKYSTGEQIRLRLFGTGQSLINRVFPNVLTPPATTGVSPLQDFKDGVFTAVEFGLPSQDAGGLFPNYPEVADSIIAAGAPHHYLTSWWTPMQSLELWINKTVYDAFTADQKELVLICAHNSCNRVSADVVARQGQFLKTFQDLGAILHPRWPHDILKQLNAVAGEVLDEDAAAEGTGAYTAILNSMKSFISAQRIRLENSNVPKKGRFWPGWDPDVSV